MNLFTCVVAVFLIGEVACGGIQGNTNFYNYYDEIATSICAAIPREEGSGQRFAVRRKCNEHATCQDICTCKAVTKQIDWEWTKHLTHDCVESLHIYKDRPCLAPNPGSDNTDVHKIGLLVKRYYTCGYRNPDGCGPNYCCCTKAHKKHK